MVYPIKKIGTLPDNSMASVKRKKNQDQVSLKLTEALKRRGLWFPFMTREQRKKPKDSQVTEGRKKA
jgi:hypothetical protein